MTWFLCSNFDETGAFVAVRVSHLAAQYCPVRRNFIAPLAPPPALGALPASLLKKTEEVAASLAFEPAVLVSLKLWSISQVLCPH